MKVFVTGSEGYIGSLLVPYLESRGHDVIGLDTGFYIDGLLYDGSLSGGRKIRKDIRHIEPEDIRGMDAVIHLAELSNDPLGQHNERNTYNINHQASVRLAKLSKEAGVSRFVYTSSCSVYGIQTDGDHKTETSDLHPQTAYAKCKVLVERDVSALADDNFSPTFLRNATAYGASPRMRFDLVVNNLSGWAWTARKIRMTSDGSPWRPLVHVLDICEAIRCVLDAERSTTHNQIFNVGDSEHNYRIREVAEIVANTFPGCDLTIGSSDGDNRSYRVSFEKIRENLPDFQCRYDVRRGAEQLKRIFEEIAMTTDIFNFRPYTRLKQLEYLIRTQQIDEDFFWKLEQPVTT